MKAPPAEEVVATVTRIGGDGYVPLNDILLELRVARRMDRRTAQRGIRRAVNQGFLLERRGPDGRLNLAVASEGWRLVG